MAFIIKYTHKCHLGVPVGCSGAGDVCYRRQCAHDTPIRQLLLHTNLFGRATTPDSANSGTVLQLTSITSDIKCQSIRIHQS